MKKITLIFSIILSGCVFTTERRISDGFLIAYGDLSIKVVSSVEGRDILEEASVTLQDDEGNELSDLGKVRKSDKEIFVSINPNWGRQFGDSEECLYYSGERYCRDLSQNKLEFEDYLVIKIPDANDRKFSIMEIKNCSIPGLVCENIPGGGWLVTLDIAVVQH